MTQIDWTLLIGYPLEEAEEYLAEEQTAYRVVMSAPPKKTVTADDVEIRVIGVRWAQEQVELICCRSDWSIS